MIAVPLKRYEKLAELETRVAVATEKIARDGHIGLQELLWTLGTDFAVDLAFEYREKGEKEHEIEIGNLAEL